MGGRRAARRRATPARGRERRSAAFLDVARGGARRGSRRSRRELDRIADARRRFRCASYEELLERAAAADDELAALEDGRRPGSRRSRRRSTRRRRVSPPSPVSCVRRAPRERRPLRRRRRGRAPGRRSGRRASSASSCASAPTGRAPTGADEAVFLVRPNRGLPFAPVAETASRRRAVAHRARNRRGRRRRHDGVRRDRRRHRRPDRPRRRARRSCASPSVRRWSRSRTYRRSRAVADRHFRVEKVPGDPTHTRIEELTDEERRDELERMLGGRGVPGRAGRRRAPLRALG